MPPELSCPVCGSTESRRIVYGYPTSDLADDPTIALGGCLVTPDPPSRQCSDPTCGHEFGFREERASRPRPR